MDLDDTRAFVTATELGSLSRAAKALGVPKSTVGRRIESLERRLQLRLLERSASGLRLTPAAEGLVPALRELLADAERITQEARAAAGTRPRVIRVTAPLELSMWFVVEALARFSRQHPSVGIELVGSERMHDLFRDGFDLAIRLGEQRDSALIARKLGAPPALKLYAARAYAERLGLPAGIKDLEAHRCVLFSPWQEKEVWTLTSGRRRERLRPRGVLTVNSLLLVHQALRHGLGVGLVPPFLVEHELREGHVVPVLPEWSTPTRPLYAVYKLPKRRLDVHIAALVECLQGSADLLR
jgi:LysR family transcriptional regulator for bpeEF and oprC